MRPLVALVFICMLLPKADAGQLSCYTCDPLKCDNYVEGPCVPFFDYCLTASATVANKKVILKTCATKQICDASQSLAGLTLEDVKCCQRNLCNGAESFTLSFLLMFIPLLSSILFY